MMDEADGSSHGPAIRIGKSGLQRDRIAANRSGNQHIASPHHGFHLNTSPIKRWDRGSYRAGLVSLPRLRGAHHKGDDNRQWGRYPIDQAQYPHASDRPSVETQRTCTSALAISTDDSF